MKKAASDVDIHGMADTNSFETAFNTSGQNGQPEQSGLDAAAAAAAIAAAKLNAMLVAQAKAAADSNATAESLQDTPGDNEDESGEGTGSSSSTRGNGVVPIREGKERDEFVADIDINDIKHRYILTKGSTQTQVRYRQP